MRRVTGELTRTQSDIFFFLPVRCSSRTFDGTFLAAANCPETCDKSSHATDGALRSVQPRTGWTTRPATAFNLPLPALIILAATCGINLPCYDLPSPTVAPSLPTPARTRPSFLVSPAFRKVKVTSICLHGRAREHNNNVGGCGEALCSAQGRGKGDTRRYHWV
jgi:hypothetical protein